MIIARGRTLEKQFGVTTLFKDISFSIENNTRIGLVGPNGVRKTAPLRIMTGEEESTKGEFTVNKDIDIGYIAQENALDEGKSIWDEMITIFAPLIKQGETLTKMQEQIADNPEGGDLLKRYNQIQFDFEQGGGCTYQADIKSALDGFNFRENTWTKKVSSLSGDEKTRLSFVKLLLKRPDLLLLDELTNYFDLGTLDWLEGFLKSYDRAILTMSHDQYFLDHLATQIFEMRYSRLTIFKGDYTHYLAEYKLRDVQREAAYEKQQGGIEKTEEFIQKNIVHATTTKRARSRRKQLEKMGRVDPPKHSNKMRINFKADRPSGKEVLVTQDLTVSHPDKTMVSDISFQVDKRDQVVITGSSGVGKSTLLETIMEKLAVKSGSIKYGASLGIGYYDQELQGLDCKKTVIDTIWDRHKSVPEKDARSILASFLFTAKDIGKVVGQLSGGQRARLTLIVLTLEHDNFLIVDEPTNHLGIEAKEVFEQALSRFDGTLLFVSHGRYFTSQLADKIISVRTGHAKLYESNHEYCLGEKDKSVNQLPEQIIKTETKVSENKLSYQEQKKLDSQKRKLQRTVDDSEAKADELGQKEADIQTEVAGPEVTSNFDELGPLQEDLSKVQAKLDQTTNDWKQAVNDLDNFG